MRLDKILANMGFGTRKEVKEMIKKNRVTVNGKVVKNGRHHADPEQDTIMVNQIEVEYRQYIYVMLNKPQGYLSATEDVYDKTVIDLLDPALRHFDPFPIGRLDKDTEGLLLLTNHGQLAHQFLSPKKDIGKTYFARIQGRVTEEDVEAFQQGVTLDDGYKTKPANLSILSRGEFSEIELTITEGKFHQVKRMFESVGKKVVYLQRTHMGNIELDEHLALGEYRELTDDELDYCLSLIPEEMK